MITNHNDDGVDEIGREFDLAKPMRIARMKWYEQRVDEQQPLFPRPMKCYPTDRCQRCASIKRDCYCDEPTGHVSLGIFKVRHNIQWKHRSHYQYHGNTRSDI